jgi:hypothetical protein
MRRSCSKSAGIAAVIAAAMAASCGAPKDSAPAGRPAAGAESSQASRSLAAPAAPGLEGRRGELLNPDASTVVMLYFDLAKLPVPHDQWVDGDNRVQMARAADKPAQRAAVKAELEAGLAGVRSAGAIRMSILANLGEYDATYGEFTVRAFAPSSLVEFKAFGQTVSLRFGNARAAQVWRVPQSEAQGVRDRIGYAGVSADALLQIRDVHAAPGGGTITVNVIEYELREDRGGTLLGRVQPAQ